MLLYVATRTYLRYCSPFFKYGSLDNFTLIHHNHILRPFIAKSNRICMHCFAKFSNTCALLSHQKGEPFATLVYHKQQGMFFLLTHALVSPDFQNINTLFVGIASLNFHPTSNSQNTSTKCTKVSSQTSVLTPQVKGGYSGL